MASSHADSHDLDKLARWRKGLTEAGPQQFPVYAVFLVSPEDRGAHDVFREFRSSFEEGNAPFENLVIFGQHGVSSTVKGLLRRLDQPLEALPFLVLFSSLASESFNIVSLSEENPSKAREGEPWRSVLKQIKAAMDAGEQTMELASIQGLTSHSIRGGSLETIINCV